MTGWLVVLGSSSKPADYVEAGAYGTFLNEGARINPAHLKTLADYATMRSGDLVFFFQRRFIYGVGQLVDAQPGEPAVCNWPESDNLRRRPPRSRDSYLWPKISKARWLCTFEPAPMFFAEGVDMDTALGLDRLGVLYHLKILEGRSFFKLEDSECDLLLEAVLRANPNRVPLAEHRGTVKRRLRRLVRQSPNDYVLDPKRTVQSTLQAGRPHELAVQVWLDSQLARRRLPLFGSLTYIGNLEPASPTKPRKYMDEMDIFGISTERMRIAGRSLRAVRSFSIIELKARNQPIEQVIRQTMKYVDWVAHQRVGGDYGYVRAFVVAPSFDSKAIASARKLRERQFVRPVRPYAVENWTSLTLVQFALRFAGGVLRDIQLREAATRP